jgi:hypothetical protein
MIVKTELVCDECEASADDRAVGWRMYLADPEGKEPELLTYCASCSPAELDDTRPTSQE